MRQLIRTFSLCALIAVAATIGLPAMAQDAVTVLNAITGTTTSAGTALRTGSAESVQVHAYSASSSSSTVLIQQSLDGTNWYTVATITDVASTGALYIGPPAPYTRCNLSAHASGTVSCKIATLQTGGGILGWKAIESLPTQAITAATNTTNVAVTNDTTTAATMYPSWFTTTTGNLPAYVSSSKLSFVPSTGVLTATGFAGALTGTASISTAATITNATTAATMYPVWVTANTGNLPLKTTSGALSFYPSTGILTSTGFATPNNGSIKTPRYLSIDGTGGAPTVAGTTSNACGTTPPAIAGKDQAGTVTVGATSGTSCTITFGTAWSVNIPACVASQNGTSTITSVVPSLTTLVIGGTFTAGDKVAFMCLGY